MADGYAFPLGDATHPYSNTGDSLRRTDGVAWIATASGPARPGKRPGPGFAVSILSGPERVRVGPGRAIVTHSTNGHYKAALVNTVDVALAARPASGTSRIDLVVLRVYDAGADASTNRVDVVVEVVTGAATATPSAPSTPDGSLVLHALLIPAGSAAIVPSAASIFTVAAGGIAPVASEADRDTLGVYDGLKVYRLDTNTFQSRIGGAWVSDPTAQTVADAIAAAVAAATPKYVGGEVAPIGSNPPAKTTKVTREGSAVVSTTAGGGFVVPLPDGAFPNGITFYAMTPGDGASSLAYVRANLSPSTKTQLFGTAYKTDGTVVASAQIRVNWQAVGW